jgi:hypothetical protein
LHAHIDARAQQSGITDYDTVSVKHSFAEIERANEWLSNELAQARRESADFSSGMLPHRNQVRLGLPPGGVFNAAQGEVVAKAKTQLGDMLLVEENPGHFELDVCAYPNCDAPLRGGIGIDDGTSTCTAGFVGESRVDSKLYLFTVGHCISDHTTNWFAADSSGNRTAIGAAWNHIYGDGGDMAIIRINDVVNWDPQNWVYVSDGNGTTVDEEYPITSVDYSTVGKRVCASGAVSGASNCGTVQELGVSRGDVNNLGRASYCRVHGDSGAPIFSYNVGYGLHHAGDDSCDAYFQSLKWAEEKMNVNALTSPR